MPDESKIIDVVVRDDGVIEVSGDIDLAGGPTLEATLVDHDANGIPIVIDLGGVQFIDSSGLRVLLAAVQRAKHRGAPTVSLRRVGPEVRRLLEITGTSDFFDVQYSLPDQ